MNQESVPADSLDEATHAERNINLGVAFTRQILDDPSLLDAIPDGATLVLIPTDDPALAEANIAIAIGEIHKGRDVYIRHVRLADLPSYESGDQAPVPWSIEDSRPT